MMAPPATAVAMLRNVRRPSVLTFTTQHDDMFSGSRAHEISGPS